MCCRFIPGTAALRLAASDNPSVRPKPLVLYRGPTRQLPRFFCRIRTALVSRFRHSRTMRGDNWTLILQEMGSVF